jgi:hypothetical protein
MRPLHEQEIEAAKERIAATGRDQGHFAFDLAFMEPDPDGGGMFTVRYEVTVTNDASGKSAGYIGGIGLDWVSAFDTDLGDGLFD